MLQHVLCTAIPATVKSTQLASCPCWPSFALCSAVPVLMLQVYWQPGSGEAFLDLVQKLTGAAPAVLGLCSGYALALCQHGVSPLQGVAAAVGKSDDSQQQEHGADLIRAMCVQGRR